MANARFVSVGKMFLDGDIDLLSDTIKVVLIDTDVVAPNVSTHDYFDDVASAAVASATLASKTTTAGAFDSADPTFTAATGNESEELVLYSDTGGGNDTDPLIANYDTFSSGMPVQPNGGDITVQVHSSGWFTI